MANVLDLKKELYSALQDSSEIASYNAKLRDKYEKREKDFNREREQWDRDRKKWSKKLGGIVTENQNLQFENASKAISLANFKSELDIKSKKITTLQNEMKLSQKDSSKKESEIKSLKSKIVELALKISELERLKSEDISGSIIGGGEEKNTQSEEQSSITKSDDISLGSTDLSKYFIRRKNMDPIAELVPGHIEKIDGNISTYTRPLLQSNDPLGLGASSRHDEITELSKNNAEINPKLGDENSISKISEDLIPQSREIKNVTPYLAQPENYTPSLVESNSQMTPLWPYMLLILLIIAVVWFVVRRTWGLDRKSAQLRDAWIG